MRTPWLRGRTLLLMNAIWDAAAIALSYSLVYAVKIEGIERSNGLVAMVCCWVSGSYITGRYSTKRTGNERGLAKDVGSMITVCLWVLLVFIVHSWLYGIVDAGGRLKGFLLPVLMIGAGIAGMGEALAKRLANSREEKWLILVNNEEKRVLEMEVKNGRLGRIDIEIYEDVRSYLEVVGDADVTRQSLAIGRDFFTDNKLVKEMLDYRKSGGTIVDIASWCEYVLQRTPPELVDEGWFIAADGFSLRAGSFFWRTKRVGDIVGALVLIMVTLPFAIIALGCVLIEDGRPLFYKQKRTGLYEREITIWKIRSMKKNAEAQGIQWSKRGDTRITAVGRIIRKLRIDELPQLVSVISGELSLIGPRPERAEIEEKLVRYIDHYRIRHWVRPGLSGWAQVSYPYGASILDSRQKLSYDIYYIRNAGILLDLLVLVKTVRLVLRGKGSVALEGR